MKLPTAVLQTRDRYVVAFPMWSMPPGVAAEERGRQWTLGLIAQIGFEHESYGYGSKRADPNRPISKDSMAQQTGGTLWNWDMLSGTGTGTPSVNANPDGENITGQIYVYVAPRNVIGNAPVPPTPTPTPPPSGTIPYDENKSIQFGLGCNDVYTESGAAFDPGMIAVHSSRAAWDYYVGGLTWDVSFHKHINEFRAVYGLPPV